jgi:hypothetical protein
MFSLDFVESQRFGGVGIKLVELTGVLYSFGSIVRSFFSSTVVETSVKARSRRCLVLNSLFVCFLKFGLNVLLFELSLVNLVVTVSVQLNKKIDDFLWLDVRVHEH